MHWHLQVRQDSFCFGHRLDRPVETRCLLGRGWEEMQRCCSTSGTSWRISSGSSGIVSQRLPKSSGINESSLLCLPTSLDWLKGWQDHAAALPAAGEARREWFLSLSMLWFFLCKSQWEQRTTLSFPAATLCWLIKARCYLIFPLGFGWECSHDLRSWILKLPLSITQNQKETFRPRV